jgi:outer membrane receptor protein involved in Fe transport
MSAWRKALVALFAAPLLSPLALHGQRPAAEIRLEIRDPSGAAVEASGKLANIATGATRSFRTDSQGRYTIEDLAYGRYHLELTRAGFDGYSEWIDVQSGAPVSRAITMTVGASAIKIDVVGTTPLAGVGLELNQIAAPVQAATQRDLDQSGALDLSDFLNRRLSSVNVNEIQGNPFQPDVNYRGYTASPLLGTPQGLSVYMDGVRLNQPFGDVVSWDLIPRIAISEMALMPGSNPLFGLNTLGGALSVQTKDGHSAPGSAVQISGGSFGRRAAEFEHGGANTRGLNWYLAGNLFFEDGWRTSSPSNVRQFLGKLGWQGARTTLGLMVAYANNALNGNGPQEVRFLQREYSSVYTKPDITANRSPFLNFTARRTISSSLTFFGNVYYRYIRANTLNGDLNENSLDQAVYQPSAADIRALTAAGYTGFPTNGATAANTPFPYWRCIAQALQRDEPGEKCNARLNRTHSEQNNSGASGQMSWSGSPGGHRNQLTAGAAFDRSSVDFRQSSELGYLNPDRSVTGVGAFGDGVTGGNINGVPYDTRVDLHGLIRTGSVYATNTLSIGNVWNFTLSGRYNRTSIDNTDRIASAVGPGSLSGRHMFDRFNPAAGVTFNPTRIWNLYFGYSEGSRAPTSIELGCADPSEPCKLPNAMTSDPPLDQVITRTWEGGLRGGLEGGLKWSAGWYRADNRQDILFVASDQTGFGYFRNFGKTRRQGVELGASSRIRRVSLGGGYTFLDATYQSPETVNGSSNSTNGSAKGFDGQIQIRPGSEIPLIPRHMVKAFADVQATQKAAVDLTMLALSGSYARGNENNLHQSDGTYYLGPGRSPGYVLLSLGGKYQARRWMQVFAQVNNLLDRRYYSAAQLGPTGLTDGGTFIARPFPAVGGEFAAQHTTFFAPGAPRAAWGGMRFTF